MVHCPIPLLAAVAVAGCALLGEGDATAARIEVVNDLPRLAGFEEGVRVRVISVDRPEVDRLLGTVPNDGRRTFAFSPATWDRSYRLQADGRTVGPVALGAGIRIRWTLSMNLIEILEPPLEGDDEEAAA